ncbi:hypothetical protein [Paraburkholderia sp. PGU19]|uniref:hypothetical protein n=1 Tax=Paraburkholderia sp. PGU19 TaxID=2735434 RepID=UPI0015DA2A4B|nr:hypothetical protein [Paraburkholderia sp. PGU19]
MDARPAHAAEGGCGAMRLASAACLRRLIARNLPNFTALSESFCVLTRFTNPQSQRNPRDFRSTLLRKSADAERWKYRHTLHYSPFVAHPAIN